MHMNKGSVIWLTGISGAGKTTIASALGSLLRDMGVASLPLDGDVLRKGLSRDLSFTDADRLENMRRAAELAKLVSDHGQVAIASLISPSEEGRNLVRTLVGHDRFAMVHVNTPLDIAESRDVKGLYKQARTGHIRNFTGIDSGYETPRACELVIDTQILAPMTAAERIVEHMRQSGWLN